MSSTYAGNPAAFPIDYPIPDDTDPPTAAAVNPALEALGDRTANLQANLAFIASVQFTAGSTWTCPDNVRLIQLLWCGGGGGGAGGGRSGIGTDESSCGGGGGGGAQLTETWLEVTPGTVYEFVQGIGGTGGTGATTAGGDSTGGSSGSNSRFKLHLTPFTQLATAKGASGGRAPLLAGFNDYVSSSSPDDVLVCPGGTFQGSLTDASRPLVKVTSDQAYVGFANAPGDGGDGTTRTAFTSSTVEFARRNGRCSTSGQSFGSGGSPGTDDGFARGGGPGGGGGAGAFGPGAAGADGGNASATGAAGNGNAGSAATANSGAGGGGGSGAGWGLSSTGIGGNGGNGGGGFCLLRAFGSTPP